MDLTRRRFLQLGGGAAALAVGARPVIGASLRPSVAWSALVAQAMPEADLPSLLLSRAAFGARPGEIERARAMGPDAWIEEQLDYETIDSSQVEDRLSSELPSLSMTPTELWTYGDGNNLVPTELVLATLYRMVYSPRMLYEVMVEFWSDHFNIHHRTGSCRYLKTIDNEQVIRRHALGKFRDLLTASATSAAMMDYLDNDVNYVNRPNENYGREIMELHTLGAPVDGYPYTEDDVKNVARCLTGWTWDRTRASDTFGSFQYVDRLHDQGPKTVLGNEIGSGMKQQDGYEVLRILVEHEATARLLATKLVRRFVTDDPLGETPELVDRTARRYVETDGDIREMLNTVLRSREFAASFAAYGGRMSRPMDFIVRSMRTTGLPSSEFPLTTSGNSLYQRVLAALSAMGHVPYNWITPDGYPDTRDAWATSSVMLTRWNFGLALAGAGGGRFGRQLLNGYSPIVEPPAEIETAGPFVDFWIERLLHRSMLEEDRNTVLGFLTPDGQDTTRLSDLSDDRKAATIALIVDSPYFAWR